jgi:DNA invertase Pin-like site-specific DNA recombinase
MDKQAIAIYLRVSTANQDLRSQEPDLKAWLTAHGRGRPVRWYRDIFSGKTMRRPAMETLEADIVAGKVSTVVVWRVDRLGRTAAGVLAFLERLDVATVKFVAVRDGFDSDTPAGRLVRGVLAQVAAYEREVISDRIRAGIAKAKADGKRWGGRKKGQRTRLTDKTVHSINALLAAGTKKAEIARQLRLSERSVYRAGELPTTPSV